MNKDDNKSKLPEDVPSIGLYCPARENHRNFAQRLLAAFSKDSLFLVCPEHDWLRIEFFIKGKRIRYENVSAVVTQVKNDEKKIFDLKPLPIHARGTFKVRNRKWREDATA